MRFVLPLAAVLAACNSPQSEPPRSAAAPVATDTGVVQRVGVVRVVGSAPVDIRVTVQEQDGQRVAIHGPLAAEIGRLSGAEVEVEGRPHNGGLEATRYRVRAVHGAPVVTGTVERAPGGGLQLRTEQGEVVRLSGADEHLRVGQKVWVQGPSTIQVQTYGVIRP